MRIRGLINYGAPSPMGSSFTASAQRKREAPALPDRPVATADAVYAWLLEIAKKGERAPTLDQIAFQFKGGPSRVAALAREGRIRIEVWAHNWRVIEIEGLRTMKAPTGNKPYRVVDGRSIDQQRKGLTRPDCRSDARRV